MSKKVVRKFGCSLEAGMHKVMLRNCSMSFDVLCFSFADEGLWMEPSAMLVVG